MAWAGIGWCRLASVGYLIPSWGNEQNFWNLYESDTNGLNYKLIPPSDYFLFFFQTLHHRRYRAYLFEIATLWPNLTQKKWVGRLTHPSQKRYDSDVAVVASPIGGFPEWGQIAGGGFPRRSFIQRSLWFRHDLSRFFRVVRPLAQSLDRMGFFHWMGSDSNGSDVHSICSGR